MKCRLCGNDKTEILFVSQNVHGRHLLGKEKFEVCQCLKCGVVFTNAVVDATYYRKYYPNNYYKDAFVPNWVTKIIALLDKLIFIRRLNIIDKYLPNGGKVLEIGCGQGDFLHQLPKKFEKFGIEINNKACQFIKNNYKEITLFEGKTEKIHFPQGLKFDMVIMWHVLEHIENPAIFFKALKKILKKDAILIIEIPNRDSLGFRFTKEKWFHLDTPRHLFFYNFETLKKILIKNQLKIVDYFGDFFSFPHDLAFSAISRNKINIIFVPLLLLLRLVTAFFVPKLSEINIYLIKNQTK